MAHLHARLSTPQVMIHKISIKFPCSIWCQKVKKKKFVPDWVLIKIIKNHQKIHNFVLIGQSIYGLFLFAL
jgi:hypothetical protein